MRSQPDTQATEQIDSLLLHLDSLADSPRPKPAELRTLSRELAFAWEAHRLETGFHALTRDALTRLQTLTEVQK